MSLWNLIRDFFVQNIFGGYLSNGDSVAMSISRGRGINSTTANVFFNLGDNVISNNAAFQIPIGDWLSTTFTIITLILLVIFLYIFVKWIFKLFSGLLR